MNARLACALIGSCALAACAPDAGQILVQVDAELAVVGQATSLHVSVSNGSQQVDAHDFMLSGTRPNCLPLSFGVAPAEDTEPDVPLTLSVQLSLLDGRSLRHTVETRLETGFRRLPIMFSAACLAARPDCDEHEILDQIPEADEEAVKSAVAGGSCHQALGPIACLEAGGCFAGSDPRAPVCLQPCPTPPTPLPPEPPEPPAAPQPVQIAPCPETWSSLRPAESGEPTYCRAFEAEIACPAGEARFPGDAACAPLGPTCPAGELPVSLPAGATVVRTGMSPTLAEAIAAARPGATLVLGRGRHPGVNIPLLRPIRIMGACVADTVIEGDRRLPIFTLTSSGVELENLTLRTGLSALRVTAGTLTLHDAAIEDTASNAIELRSGGDAIVDRLTIADSGRTGFLVDGATLSADRLRITATRHAAVEANGSATRVQLQHTLIEEVAPASSGSGYGVRVLDGAHARVIDGEIRGFAEYGAAAEGPGSSLFLEQVAIADAAPLASNHGGGIRLSTQAELIAHKLSISAVSYVGLYANARSRAVLSDLKIGDVSPQGGATFGMGIICSSSCYLQIERAHLARVRRRGVELSSGATAVIDDLIVHQTLPSPDGSNGTALEVSRADLHARRLSLDAFHRAGLRVLLEPSRAEIDDLVVRDPLDSNGSGEGIELDDGAELILRRARISGCRTTGLDVNTSTGSATRLDAQDLSIEDTSTTQVAGGYGLSAGYSGAAPAQRVLIDIRRASFLRNMGAGVLAGWTTLSLHDLALRDTMDANLTPPGPGIFLFTDSNVTGERIQIARSSAAGILANNAPTGSATFSDLDLSDTICGATSGAGCGVLGGTGVALALGGRIEISRFSIADNFQSGLQLNFGGDLDLRDGKVSGHPTGAYVRVEGYNVLRLAVGVLYVDNERSIEVVGE